MKPITTRRSYAYGLVCGYLLALLISVLGVAHGRTLAICRVWHPCGKALAVAWCESRFDIHARNGQYLGLFQMGDYARSTYGHSWTALGQARAAHRYWLVAGWSPWECA